MNQTSEATGLSQNQARMDRPAGYLDIAINAARGNIGCLMHTVVALEQAANRLHGPEPTPIETSKVSVPTPADPPLLTQLHQANDDMTQLLARLDAVASRLTALA